MLDAILCRVYVFWGDILGDTSAILGDIHRDDVFNRGRVRDDRIQVEFLVINLLGNTKAVVFLQGGYENGITHTIINYCSVAKEELCSICISIC